MLDTATTREQSASDAATRALARASERTSDNQRDDRSQPMPQSHEPRMNRIARRAHEIYEARGGEHGTELDDWLQAEREVDLEIDASRGAEG